MPTFQVPLSSSPPVPSTPGTASKYNTGYPSSSSPPAHPSTTPTGPPPSSIGSFTPAGPPPLSLLGSSQLGPGKTLFKSSKTPRSSTLSERYISPTTKSDQLSRQLEHSSRFNLSNGSLGSLKSSLNTSAKSTSWEKQPYDARGSQDSQNIPDGSQADYELDNENSSKFLYDSQNHLDLENHGLISPEVNAWEKSRFSPRGPPTSYIPGSSLISPLRGVKRSHWGAKIAEDPQAHSIIMKRHQKSSVISSIAQNMADQMNAATLLEDDDFILDSEALIDRSCSAQRASEHPQPLLSKSAEELCNLWASYLPHGSQSGHSKQDEVIGIGPSEEAPPLQKAIFLGLLLLRLHHPPAASGKQALALSSYKGSLSAPSYVGGTGDLVNSAEIPKMLIEWLDQYNNPWRSMFLDVETRYPSPTAHYNFWDMILTLTLRGRLRDAVRMLSKADFRYADSAPRDGETEGYTEKQLKNIDKVVGRTIEVLQRCPAIMDDDWHVAGNDWAIFRKLVEQALDELICFAEDRERESELLKPAFVSTSLALRSSTMSHSQIARRAESRVPWTVYQSLRALYGILLGGVTEMLASAQDWVEATIGLTIWWAGDDDTKSLKHAGATNRSSRESRQRKQRPVDVDANSAYLDKLAQSFHRATEGNNDEDFQINSDSPVEVGLACVLEGDFEGVLGILHGWSLPITTAVAEIATLGGWFSSSSASDGIMKNFDQSDLMVLSSYGQPEPFLRRDKIMIEYANALFDRGTLRHGISQVERDGWQLSIAVLVRVGDDETCRSEVGKILSRVNIDSNGIMSSILDICGRYGLVEEASALAEKYADFITATSYNYGTALRYYARGHCEKKIRNVLDLLVSMSLIRSAAFPPSTALDHDLRSFIYDPNVALDELSAQDNEAAATLHALMSGYATLRKFYDIRDGQDSSEEIEDVAIPIVQRRRKAVSPLLALIRTSSDNIAGGLFDERSDSVLRLDGLLVLLGEALVFVNQPDGFLSLDQCFALTKGVEDLQTVSRRHYDLCDRCFQSTIAFYYGCTQTASPRRLLETMSNMTSASSFSLVGSSMLDSGSIEIDNNDNSEQVKDQLDNQRGWDWRAGMKRRAKGENLLRILRLGLAREIAKHWMDSEI